MSIVYYSINDERSRAREKKRCSNIKSNNSIALVIPTISYLGFAESLLEDGIAFPLVMFVGFSRFSSVSCKWVSGSRLEIPSSNLRQ